MIFLIEYDRDSGRLKDLQTFDESERQEAQDARLDLELRLNKTITKHEVVLIEAATEDDLRRTHRRYFEDLAELRSAVGSHSA